MSYSETFLARDMFIAYWQLCQASILYRARVLGFERAQREIAMSRVDEHTAFVRHLETATGLSRRLLENVAADGPWRIDTSCPLEEAWADVSLRLGQPVGPDTDLDEVEAELLQAVELSAAGFAEAFVAAQYAFNLERASPPADLRLALHALGDCIRPSPECAERVERGYDLWSHSGVRAVAARPEADPSFVSWLVQQSW